MRSCPCPRPRPPPNGNEASFLIDLVKHPVFGEVGLLCGRPAPEHGVDRKEFEFREDGGVFLGNLGIAWSVEIAAVDGLTLVRGEILKVRLGHGRGSLAPGNLVYYGHRGLRQDAGRW